MIIGYVWVIFYIFEVIYSKVSYIIYYKNYFSKLYENDINFWIIVMFIFCIFIVIFVFIFKLFDYKKNKSIFIKKYS
ncbi:hypothetical protein, partial [Klebsiella pneumoniae]|uniref:hypothetical protein n=1 Tax=Klebsiella pneumoniae TaxID=573 RepID=UPI00273129C7